MSTIEDHGMSAAEKDHDAEQRLSRLAWEARRKPSPSITQTRAADDDAIKEAMYDAICDGEGHSNAYYLKHHLALRGLVIVEASKWDILLTTVQTIASQDGTSHTCPSVGSIITAARAALEKMEA